MGGSPVEDMIAQALRAAALDSIELALSTGAFAGAILATDQPQVVGEGLPAGLIVDADRESFQFGQRLAELVSRYKLDSIVYLGGGSLPLLTANSFRDLADTIIANECIITNNRYSSDLVALRPATAVTTIEPPASDNELARALADHTNLPISDLPRTLSTLLDIDGPGDLAILSLVGGVGWRLDELLMELSLDLSRYQALFPLLTDRRAQIMVAGRVGSHAWKYLERETACRVRMLAEERGMEADGRLDRGEVRSLLGFYLEEVGVERLFTVLGQLGDAVLIDSRVILGHLSLKVERRQRFFSDLGHPEEMENSILRDLTVAALEAPIPVLLGGHSLMSGGIMALNELAWKEREQT